MKWFDGTLLKMSGPTFGSFIKLMKLHSTGSRVSPRDRPRPASSSHSEGSESTQPARPGGLAAAGPGVSVTGAAAPGPWPWLAGLVQPTSSSVPACMRLDASTCPCPTGAASLPPSQPHEAQINQDSHQSSLFLLRPGSDSPPLQSYRSLQVKALLEGFDIQN